MRVPYTIHTDSEYFYSIYMAVACGVYIEIDYQNIL